MTESLTAAEAIVLTGIHTSQIVPTARTVADNIGLPAANVQSIAQRLIARGLLTIEDGTTVDTGDSWYELTDAALDAARAVVLAGPVRDPEHLFSDTDPDGPCTDECVATHPAHAETRGDLRVNVSLSEGDGKTIGTVTIGEHTVTVYESLIEDGRIVIDVDGEPGPVNITLNDGYVQGGPAATADDKTSYNVEILRTIVHVVQVRAVDEHEAVIAAKLVIPSAHLDGDVLDGAEFVVYDEAGANEVYRTDT